MHRFSFGLLAVGTLLAVVPAQAQQDTRYSQDIAELAKIHRVPERLIHRIIVRESRYNPRAQHSGNYGLMQIKPATARGMGYRGSPAGLLIAKTNLTYGVPYLANAYRVAGGNEDRAVQLYAGGYYYAAKRKGMLAKLTSAHTDTAAAEAPQRAAAVTVVPPTAPPVEAQAYAGPASPFEALASIFSPPPAPVAAPEPQVEQAVAQPATDEQPRKRDRRRHR
jgi:soluble lytic murein transglycosylase-like protein